MRLGIALPTTEADGQPLRAKSLADASRRIEAAGFASAWVFDSLGRGFLLPEPLTTLAVAASVTRTLELGTGVGAAQAAFLDAGAAVEAPLLAG